MSESAGEGVRWEPAGFGPALSNRAARGGNTTHKVSNESRVTGFPETRPYRKPPWSYGRTSYPGFCITKHETRITKHSFLRDTAYYASRP
ncbi:MAG: hypothetical protein OXB98_15535 [Bryobacterales bacterium]|nr:hypothetical protein [Bryobacterales bacterium]